MDKQKLIPYIVLAVSLIVSSLILSFSMSKLGDDIIAAGIHSRKISLEHANNRGPLKIVLDDNSELKIKSNPDSGN